MEPTLSCEDEAYGEVPSGPGDISAGAIISFSSPADCLDGHIVHRIIAIEIVDGNHFYQTQGDAVNTPDSCLVPFSAVNYIIIDIFPAVSEDPRIAQLRGRVNSAKAATETALGDYNAARDETARLAAETDRAAAETKRLAGESDAAAERTKEAERKYKQAYNIDHPQWRALYAQYLKAHEEWQETYKKWEIASAKYRDLYGQWESAYEEAQRLYAVYESALATWECWLEAARSDDLDNSAGCARV